MSDGRVRARTDDGGRCELLAPTVGIFEPAVAEGDALAEGGTIGTIEVLGVRHTLVVPDGVAGRVEVVAGEGRARTPVQYGDVLLAVSTASLGVAAAASTGAATASAGSLSFVAPMSGRFYGRPSPSDEPFVRVGDVVQRGQTVGLLEVMKTFNRLVYEGEGLPDSAEVARIVPEDGDDVVRGDVILALAKPGAS